MEPFLKEIEKYGFVKSEVMKRFIDDEEFYKECYLQVLEDEAFDELGVHLKNGSKKEAFDCAHGLKGLLSNLGLIVLYDKTSEIVEILRGTKQGDENVCYNQLISLRKECLSLL